MDGLPDNLPTDSDALVALLLQQQKLHEKQLSDSQERNKQLQKNVQTKTLTIEKLEERLRALLILQFGKKSERFNPDQLDLFNEAELTAEAELDDDQGIEVKPHTRRARNPRKPIPAHLPRVDVEHELDEAERTCHCGGTLQRIGEDVHLQLSIIPRQYLSLIHI